MDSIKREEANTISHHQEKVVSSDLGIHSSNKNINSNNNTNVINNKNQQLASTHSTEIKDTNFEYDDNEWDIGIGNLIIDLDADIEKSQISIQQSNTHIDNSLTIPSSSTTTTSSSSTSQSKSTDSTDKFERKDSTNPKQGDKKTSVTASVNTKNQEEKVTMSSSTSSGNKPSAKLSIDHQATLDKGLKMKIKRTKTGTKTSEAKHEIVKAEQNGTTTSSDEGNAILNSNKRHSQIPVSPMPGSPSPATNKRGTSSHKKDKTKEKTCHSQKDKSDLSGSSTSDRNICSCGSEITANGFQSSCTNLNCVKNRSNEMSLAQRLSSNQITSNDRQNSTPNAPGPPFKDAKTPLQSQSNNSSSSNSRDGMMNENSSLKAQLTGNSSLPLSGIANAISLSSALGAASASEDSKTSSPPLKRIKCDPKEMVDVCVGTSVGTITEPDCLGPCEPGTSVTLEGIVWHETEGGVLAVNVTWRGKTYVGTLIDCTKHDWAPPRFCDSPTEELDSRTPKGRGKRGRSALTPTNDLSNFTETRSSMHSKLRNGGAKGRGGRNTTTSSSTSTTNTSTNSSSNSSNTSSSAQGTSNTPPSTSPTAFLVPRPEKRKSKDESPSPVNVNGNSSAQSNRENSTSGSSNSQTTKKPKNLTSPCAISPVLIECPEQDCSKKYKHANGLKYHQSHAHGIVTTDEDSSQAPESPRAANSSSPPPSTAAPSTSTTATTTTQSSTTSNSNNPPQNAITTNSNSNSSDTNNISQNNSTTTSVQASNNQTNNIKAESSSSSSNESTGPLALVPGTPMTSHSPSISETKSSNAIDPLAPTLSTLQQQLNDSKQLSNIAAENLSQQTGAITTTPTRTDSQSKVKPGVLRFGPLPTDSQQPSNPNNTQGKPPSINPLPDQAIYPPSASQNNSNKAQNLINKQKKNRRSPGPGDFDSSMSNKNDDVRSPAYSDISDDSTTVADSDLSDKTKISQLPDAKKSQETGGPLSSLGGYSVYPFYSQSSFFSPENQSTKPPSIPPSPADYKNKEPPLDLINKQSQSDSNSSKDLSGSSKNSQQGHPQHPPQQPPQPTASSPAGKLMSHYPHYPYNYIPGYPYNMDPNYGQLQVMSEESKLASQGAGPPPNIKDERIKDISSPSDHSKQMMSSKLIKSEPKDIKSENLSVHPKDQPPSNLGPYLYPRHGMPPQHISREEELRRYYGYPDRRANVGSNNPTATNLSAKDERSSQSPHGSSQHSATGLQLQGSSQQQPKSMKNQSGSSSMQPTNLSNQKSSSNIKQEIKSEEKEVKVKQEGQKPTMETQGPPPPPTSQYYLHPPYMSPGFGFDPSLPVYRNMLVPTPPYNTPYHLQMSRYPTPEDLSRNTKALDLLQQHASQYYNTHKIHELSERALKSPTSNVKVSVSSPNVSSQPGGPSGSLGGPGGSGSERDRGNNSGGNNSNSSNVGGSSGNAPSVMSQPNSGSGSSTNLSLQQAPGSMNPNPSPGVIALNKNLDKGERERGGVGGPGSDTGKDSASGSGSGNGGRSPPPQRHVHTHHHTHVGLGYPMYPASVPYGAAVLASQQAAAVAVINPFPAPNNK